MFLKIHNHNGSLEIHLRLRWNYGDIIMFFFFIMASF